MLIKEQKEKIHSFKQLKSDRNSLTIRKTSESPERNIFTNDKQEDKVVLITDEEKALEKKREIEKRSNLAINRANEGFNNYLDATGSRLKRNSRKQLSVGKNSAENIIISDDDFTFTNLSVIVERKNNKNENIQSY